jgi:hypothetical protein
MRGLFLTTLCISLTALCQADDIFPSTQGKEPTGMVNPSSRFQVENGWNLFLNTEFLWWIAKEDGLYYAQNGYSGSQTSLLPPATAPIFDGRLEKVNPQFRPGFRIGLGGNMPYDDWDLFIDWTWFRTKAHSQKKGSLLVLWSYPSVPPEFGSARWASAAAGKWHLQMNLLDVQIGRSFWVGKKCSLHPFIGARAAWIDQHLKNHYTLKTTPQTQSTVVAASDFEGGGARVGVNSRWMLLGGWSFYADASAALLYGFYNGHFRQKWGNIQVADSKDGFHQPASTAGLALGVEWDLYFHRDRYHVGVWAGWEQNMWFGMNKMNHFFGSASEGNLEQMNGDLSLSGGTAGLRFDF